MGKITVKHYLNTNLKPYIIDGEKYYKLYFLMRYNNKNTKMKSLLNEEMTEEEYSRRISESSDILNIRIKNEISFIEKIIAIAEKTKLAFDMKLFMDIWNIATYPVISKFDTYIQVNARKESININDYYSVLNALKAYIDVSKYAISEEIYLLQLFDKEFVTDYRKTHRKKSAKEIDNVEKDAIQIVKECLFDGFIYPFFFSCPRIEKTGNFDYDKEYYSMLFGLITGE